MTITGNKPSHIPFIKNARGQNSYEHVKKCKLLYEFVVGLCIPLENFNAIVNDNCHRGNVF